jgi:uncharacterized protein (DUF1501 family)
MATTRRDFLRAGALAGLGLGVVRPLEAALAAPLRLMQTTPRRDPILVFVNLVGGNDGLNTVVPLAQYARYQQLRPTIGWPREQLVPLPGYEQDFGLNPAMRSLVPLFRQGKVAVINGVGFPPTAAGLFDHEASHKSLETCDVSGSPPPATPTGWVGRFLDGVDRVDLPTAIDFGFSPLLLTGVRVEPLSLTGLNSFGIAPSADKEARALTYRRLQEAPQPPGVRARNSQLRQQVLDLTGPLQAINQTYRVAAGVTYAAGVGGVMRDCAALIAADRGVRALGVGVYGFDTHSGENAGAPGEPSYHQALLGVVINALTAFHADLQSHGVADRVLTLVVSEFGRRAGENNDGGTDHGLASFALAIGDPVKGGVYGDHPDLRDEYLVRNGNLAVSIDFRSVYATILAQHLGADPDEILGARFPQLAFL